MQEIDLLIVDDEADFRRAVSRALSRRGFRVSEADTGQRALEIVRASPPDIMVLDLRMPGMDGIETLRRLRLENEDLPVIIQADEGANHGIFARVYGEAKLAGAKSINFSTKR